VTDLSNKLNTRQTEAELKEKLSRLRAELSPPAQFALALVEPAAPAGRWLGPGDHRAMGHNARRWLDRWCGAV
jgi:hypothetical protein